MILITWLPTKKKKQWRHFSFTFIQRFILQTNLYILKSIKNPNSIWRKKSEKFVNPESNLFWLFVKLKTDEKLDFPSISKFLNLIIWKSKTIKIPKIQQKRKKKSQNLSNPSEIQSVLLWKIEKSQKSWKSRKWWKFEFFCDFFQFWNIIFKYF